MNSIKLQKCIDEYIDSKYTDYAIMISGEWGIGKTYFLKNNLFPTLKEKNKRYIYISFIGRNDEAKLKDDIYKKINPFYFSDDKSKVLLEAEAIEEVINGGQKKIVPDDFILCFDDLERIDTEFFEPAMGLINVFIEHYNVKTLLICNERKLENIIPKYKEIKEKYVRFTYEYNPELEEILSSVLKQKKYVDINNSIDKDVVVDVFKRGNTKNIRILLFVLDVFAKIIYLLDDNKESGSYIKTLVLHYICFYSIERKQRGIDALILNKISISFFNSQIKLADIFDINEDDNNPFSEEDRATAQIDSIEDNTIQKLQKKYFSKGHRPFEQFLSIAEYINSGFLNEEKLKKEIETINREFQRKNIKDSPTKFIEGLSDFSLTNEYFLPFIDELYEEVDKGNFDLLTYLKLYSQLVWLESFEIKGLHITDGVTEKFKNAVNKSVENGHVEYIRNLNHQIPQWDEKSKFDSFLSFVSSINDTLEVRQTENYVQELIKAIKDKDEILLEKLLSKDSDLALEENDAQKIFDTLLNSEALINKLFEVKLYFLY